MRPRLLTLGAVALILLGIAAQTAHGQYWRRPYNPAYGLFWQNYWYNYAPPNYFPGGYWYNRIASEYYPGRHWTYAPYGGYYWRYPYGYSGVYFYEVPYYVPVPDPYPVIPPSKSSSAKSPDKEIVKSMPAAKPVPSPPEPKVPLTAEESRKQEERDAARQLKLAKKLLEAAEDDERNGKEGNASNLRQFANDHFAEIAQRYPTTPAGREAQELLEKTKTP
jgi:hypothetical protein